MAAQLEYQTRIKCPTEGIDFVFSFEEFPELMSDADNGIVGQTISSAVITGPGGAALSGISAVSPGTVTTSPEIVDDEGTIVAAGKGVKTRVTSGTAGTDYTLECLATLSSGALRAVQGVVAVRNKA